MQNFIKRNIVKPCRLLFQPTPRKLLFEHIPKCGGTGIKNYLESHYPNRGIYSIDGTRPRQTVQHFKTLPEEQRFDYDLVIGHRAHCIRTLCHPDILKATLFREPVDRVVSHYYWVLRSPVHRLHQEVVSRKVSLADYVASNMSGETRNNYVQRFLQLPPDEAERDPEGSVARTLQLLRDEYDLFGTLDNVGTLMDRLAQLAGLPTRFPREKINAAGDRPETGELDETTLGVLRDANALDIQLYREIQALAG